LIVGTACSSSSTDTAPTAEVSAPSIPSEDDTAPDDDERDDETSPAVRAACHDAAACYALALAEERKAGAIGALPFYERACSLGQSAACHRLGEMYRDGVGVKPSDDEARSYFEVACQQGSTAACDALGH
jgi:hypothetical protein